MKSKNLLMVLVALSLNLCLFSVETSNVDQIRIKNKSNLTDPIQNSSNELPESPEIYSHQSGEDTFLRIDTEGGLLLNHQHIEIAPPTVDLAIGDYDTGISWINDGILLFKNNNRETFYLTSNNNIGLGTDEPIYKLHLHDEYIYLSNSDTALGTTLIKHNDIQFDRANYSYICNVNEDGDLVFVTGGEPCTSTYRMIINDLGQVGINTTNPLSGYKLHVNGTAYFQDEMRISGYTQIYNDVYINGDLEVTGDIEGDRLSAKELIIDENINAKEIKAKDIEVDDVKVKSDGADFVFDDNYEMKTLYELEHYINENNHLPDIPSANEMQTNGVSVSEFQTKLLQKIEELTLYMIEMKKENEQLKKQLSQLK